jgi:transposase-like protein
VKEIDSGDLTIEDAAENYGVIRVTVVNWLKRYSSMHEDRYTRKMASNEVKREAIAIVERGLLSRKETAKKYNITLSTLSVWIKSFSCNVIINKREMKEVVKKDDRELSIVKEENGDLKLTVDQLKLKVAALEMMIEVAEKELKIEIRKKSGTKQ